MVAERPTLENLEAENQKYDKGDPMIVYIAARYSRKLEMLALVNLFRKHNITVNSRWLYEPYSLGTTLTEMSPSFCLNTAEIDLEDIDACDTLVFFSEDPLVGTPRGGRHVEFGYGLAKGKRVVVIGPQENIFHFLPGIVCYNSVGDFLDSEGIENVPVAD